MISVKSPTSVASGRTSKPDMTEETAESRQGGPKIKAKSSHGHQDQIENSVSAIVRCSNYTCCCLGLNRRASQQDLAGQ